MPVLLLAGMVSGNSPGARVDRMGEREELQDLYFCLISAELAE